jgi:hypothetical protein
VSTRAGGTFRPSSHWDMVADVWTCGHVDEREESEDQHLRLLTTGLATRRTMSGSRSSPAPSGRRGVWMVGEGQS